MEDVIIFFHFRQVKLFHYLVVQNLNHLGFESFLCCRPKAYLYKKFQVQTKLYTYILVLPPYFFAGKSIFLINILCLQDIFHPQSTKNFTKWGIKACYVLQGQHIWHKCHCGDEEAGPGVLAVQSLLPASLSLISLSPICCG